MKTTFNLKIFLPIILLTAVMNLSFAQQSVTIGSETLNEKAVLMLVTPGGDQGLILPVVSGKETIDPGTGERGMIVFDTSDNKVYLWNGALWLDLTESGGVTISSLGDLDDVDDSGVAAGQVLKWNGTAWTPSDDLSGGVPGSIGELSDVDDTGVVAGQVLKWDGASWVPSDDQSGGAAAFTAGSGINIDGSNVISNTGDADADPTNEIDVTAQNGLLLGDGAAITGLTGISDGQVAKWNASSGSWEAGTDDAGGGSLWSQNGGNVFYNSGKVGIGTDTPEGKLAVFHNSLIADPQLMLYEDELDYARLTFKNSTGFFWTIAGRNEADSLDDRLNFYNNRKGDLMTLTGAGRLGIGVGLNPQSTLDLKGGNWDVSNTEGDFRIGNDIYRLKIGVATGGGGAGDARIRAVGGTNRIMMGGGTNDVLTITDQFVGIGTITPGAAIHVLSADNETARFTTNNDASFVTFMNSAGYQGYAGIWTGNNDMDFGTGAGNTTGKVHLTTNASSKVTVDADGDVGIGTTTPSSKLDVQGNIFTSGEVNRQPTGSANLVPIAYGSVSSSGFAFASSSGNFTVERITTGFYLITITDIDYHFQTFTTVVSINNGLPGFVATGSGGGQLQVRTYDTSGTDADYNFNFVVYQP